MTTGKTIALTRWTFVGKVMSPLHKKTWGKSIRIYNEKRKREKTFVL